LVRRVGTGAFEFGQVLDTKALAHTLLLFLR
jgi:hypothetical protein